MREEKAPKIAENVATINDAVAVAKSRKRKEHTVLATEVLKSLLDLVHVVAEYRSNNQDSESLGMHPKRWRSLKSSFIDGIAFCTLSDREQAMIDKLDRASGVLDYADLSDYRGETSGVLGMWGWGADKTVEERDCLLPRGKCVMNMPTLCRHNN